MISVIALMLTWLSALLFYSDHIIMISFNSFTSKPKCMPGSRDPGVTIVNPMYVWLRMYGYVTWGITAKISFMYGSEVVKLIQK